MVRAIYAPLEWTSLRIMEDNSVAMELLKSHFGDMPTQWDVYAAAPLFYVLKDKLERHLLARTDSLFNPTNRVIPLLLKH